MGNIAEGTNYFKVKDCPINVCKVSRKQNLSHRHDLTEVEHYHDFIEIVAITKGQGIQVVEGREYSVAAGDVFVLQGNQQHYFKDASQVDIINIMYDEKQAPWLIAESIKRIGGYRALFIMEPRTRKHRHFKNMLRLNRYEMARVEILLNEMWQEQITQKVGFEIILANRLQEYIIQLSRHYSTLKTTKAQSLIRLGRAMEYMENNAGEKVYIEELAEIANMSPRNFQRTFKNAMGISPVNYLVQIRLQNARKLLSETDISVIEIAIKCGFSDSNYFIKCFKEFYHITPLKFRMKFG